MIGIMGNDFFGKRMADAVNKTMPAVFLYSSLSDPTFIKKIKDVKIIHYLGSPTVTFRGVLNLILLKMYRKKVVVHWIGADSWMAGNLFFPRIFTKLLKNKIDLHIAIEKELLKRIEKLGIKAIIHPLPVASHYELEPLPTEKRVLVYGPDMDDYYWKRFNGELIKKIVNEFKDVHFIIVRNSGKHFDEPNVECHKWVDNMEEIYKKIIAFIRISTHDGHPGTIREALTMGRHVIYSEEIPFCKKATNYEELKKVLNEILDEPKLNVEGSKFVKEKFSIESIAEGLVKIYKKI